MSISVSLASIPERATEYMKRNPQAKKFRGTVGKTDAGYISFDKKNPVYLKKFTLDSFNATLSVYLYRPARVWLEKGTHVDVIGEEIAPNIIEARILILSGTRQVLDLGNTRELYLAPLALLIIGLLLDVSFFKPIFTFLLSSYSSIQLPVILVSIVGFFVVNSYIRNYTPTLMTLTYHEWSALQYLMVIWG